MAIQKRYLREADRAGRVDRVQALTAASTATQVFEYGVTQITSTGGGTAATHGYKMARPSAGLRKTIVVKCDSTREVKVQLAPSTDGAVLFGTTYNNLVFSTGAGKRRGIELVGLSSSLWGLVSMTTGVTTVA